MELKPLFGEIADAIRERDGTEAEIAASTFPERIRGIPAGGVALERVDITAPPAKTSYLAGESFDPAGMEVTATYSNGATLTATGYAVEPSGALADGVTEVTVRYTEGGRSATAAQPITVIPQLSRIEVAQPPAKTAYRYGEPFDPAGMEVRAVYSDGSARTVEDFTTPPGVFTATGEQGVWVAYTENGVTSETVVAVTVGKAPGSLSLDPESVTLGFAAPTAVIQAARAGDGTITAASSDTAVATVGTINQQTGEITVNSVNGAGGAAVITVRVAEGTHYLAPADKTVEVNAQFVTIYGAEWDWTSSGPTKGTRTDAAVGLADPVPAVNNGSGSSPFDNLMPWAGMVKETRAGGVEVKEPKYWFKWTKTGKKLKLQIADGPVDGFFVDPVNRDRGDGLGEVDFSYIGRYHCASDNWKSETNKAQKCSITRSAARTGIHSLGANFWQLDFAQFWYVNMLFMVEFADTNGERIGRGCSASGSKENNGKTDAMQYHTGTTAANRYTYGFTQYRNIEGWWDNVLDWMDGCYYTSSGLNVITNPNQYSDNANGVLVGKPTDGYPSDFTIPTASGLEWALYPCASSGSQTTHVPDSWGFAGGNPCLYHGGSYSQGQNRGPFCVYYNSASSTGGYIGCRLWERPPKAA